MSPRTPRMPSRPADRTLAALRATPLAPALRTARATADRLLLSLDRPPLSAEIDGVRLHGYLRHRAFLRALGAGDYEAATRRLLTRAIQPRTVVVDGGAHIGLFSLLASARLGSTGRVYAFEPDPYNFRALRHNVARAGATGIVTTVNAALADVIDTATFHSSSGTIAGSLIDKSYVHDGVAHVVSTTTIDASIPVADGTPAVLKLDVEGAEPLALAGARRLLAGASRVVVVFEQNPTALREGGFQPAASFELCAELGLQTYKVADDGRLEPLSPDATEHKGNFVALRDWRPDQLVTAGGP